MPKQSLLILALILATCSKPAPVQDVRYIIAPSGLNLRAQASPSSSAVQLLRAGTEVIVVEEQKEEASWQGLTGKWTKVRFEQTEGWAFGAFLSKQKPPRVTGRWGTCVEMVNVGPMNFGPDGSYSSVSIGMETIGRYSEDGDNVAIQATRHGGRTLDQSPPSIMRLTADGKLCSSSGECYCRY